MSAIIRRNGSRWESVQAIALVMKYCETSCDTQEFVEDQCDKNQTISIIEKSGKLTRLSECSG